MKTNLKQWSNILSEIWGRYNRSEKRHISEFWNTADLLFHYSAHKKDTKTVFIGGDKKYLPTGFEYKTASKGYLVAEIFSKQFLLKNWKSVFL